MQKLNYIDLFSGCGGLSEGFSKSGFFNGLAHVEWEIPMVETLRYRLEQKWGYSKKQALKSVIHFDIQRHQELINGNWSADTIDKYGHTNHKDCIAHGLKGLTAGKEVDLIIGGPPCQAYSMAGRKQQEGRSDYRNYLFESFIKVVEAYQPKLFVFENVPGIVSAKPDGEPVLNRIYDAFNACGYEILKPDQIKQASFVASDFNTPQKRNRIIIIGLRKDLNWDLQEVYREISKRKQPHTPTVREAIGRLPKLYPIDNPARTTPKISHHAHQDPKISQHVARYHNPTDVQVFKDWVHRNLNGASLKEQLDYYNKIKGVNSKYPKYRNIEWDKPSPTIVAHLHKDGLLFIHPDKDQARSITIREAACLQSFPRDYQFKGSNSHCFKMIGNAVPPNMAEQIAHGIFNFLKGSEA